MLCSLILTDKCALQPESAHNGAKVSITFENHAECL